ncbi:hypothetical protein GDO86_001478 [Hymenochirus boettgeri]|uniref:RecQ-mediated genome instability protein 1 n=1 Tax=Hymenochirus boettgeri TaxID=247094 RepID=A0A8T2KLN0_9PIPI|nr:hypothetical protein GDO86_001478 [Hymenochirus boettgeri]
MTTSAVANRLKTWLSSTWHVKVPDQWLEACINWIQEENNGLSLPQAEMNKQVFEQWLLTDLRDLEYPVLPAGILESLKFELNGFYAMQIDSLVDVSQPAYSQLQKLRGKDNTNEQVTAITQQTQKPWEMKPTRMLMLQLTDGTQHVQGMEYLPVPALNVNLSPGTKILIQGRISCRLGVLLLKSENVKVLGGEVEALTEEYTQSKVLSRLIGEDTAVAVQEQVNTMVVGEIGQALGPSDEDLLESLEVNEEFTMNNGIASDSGYYSRSDYSSHYSTILSFDQQHTENPRIRQSNLPMSNQVTVYPSTTTSNITKEQYDLDDELFLEEEIQRELEEMTMSQTDVEHKNTTVSVNRLPRSAIASHATFNTFTSEYSMNDAPFTYLSAVLYSKSGPRRCLKLKSFIVTLNGSLSHNCGLWNIKAKISDGTDYLDVEFSDDVLRLLIGFSAAEMRKMKKDPGQQKTLMAGLQKCQRELTDFCGIMTISYSPEKSEAIVLSLQDVNEEIMQSLEKRLYPRTGNTYYTCT